MSMQQGIETHLSQGLGHICLARPEAGNAFDVEMAAAMAASLERLRDDETVRAIVLSARGKNFCPGAALNYIHGKGPDDTEALQALATGIQRCVSLLWAMPKPIVTVVNGAAAGAGLALVLASDVAISAESARFTTAFTAAGLSPDSGVSWLLPRRIGLPAARDLLFTARLFDSAEALDLGVVDAVMADTEALDAGTARAADLARGPVRAFGEVKRLLNAGYFRDLDAHMDDESATIVRQALSPEGREGVSAFLEKRQPVFLDDR